MNNRYKPVGWRQDSARHALAAHGVKSKEYWRQQYPNLVKKFPGENPRITENFVRFRQKDPAKYTDFKTKVVGDKEIILGKNKKTGEFELQSVLIPKKARHSMAYKVVQDGVTIGRVKDASKFRSMPRYNKYAQHTIVCDDEGNIAVEVHKEPSKMVGD